MKQRPKEGTHYNNTPAIEFELASKILAVSRNNEFLICLLEKLKELNLLVKNGEARKDIRDMMALIRAQVRGKNWDELEHFYLTRHSDFMHGLLSEYPDLTANERRLCIFLQMNLSTKEISDITMQSCRAVEMARYRLRQKFDLNREDNLSTFLLRFV